MGGYERSVVRRLGVVSSYRVGKNLGLK